MTWLRVDDRFGQHPKVLAIPKPIRSHVIGVWALAGCWCAATENDGLVPEYALPDLPKAAQAAGELVRVGLWDVVPGGWAFHDWADYQPLAAEVEAQREAWRDRQAKARSRRRGSG